MFTTEEIFQPTMPYQQTRTLIMQANGGKIEVFALLDQATDLWIKTDEKLDDGGYVLSCGNAVLKVVPTGGAVYNLI